MQRNRFAFLPISGGIASLLPACLLVHQSVAGELPARLYADASTMIGSEAVCLDSVKCTRAINANEGIRISLSERPPYRTRTGSSAHLCLQTGESIFQQRGKSQQMKNPRAFTSTMHSGADGNRWII